jgi:hypothetical protein
MAFPMQPSSTSPRAKATRTKERRREQARGTGLGHPDVGAECRIPCVGRSVVLDADEGAPSGRGIDRVHPEERGSGAVHEPELLRRLRDGPDREELRELVRRLDANAPALSFHTEVAFGTFTLKYSTALRVWMMASGSDNFQRTPDILTWPGSTEIPAPQQTTHVCYDFDVDAAGNVVVLPDGIDAIQECSSAGVWNVHLAPFGGISADLGNVVYDAFSGRWIATSRDGSNAPVTIGSTDRVTWARITRPAFTGASVATLGSGSTVLAGNIVAQGFNGTNVQFSHSADGGTTWSAPQTFALGFAQDTGVDRYPKPIWNGSYWLACASSSGTASKIFKSTDGITWTNVATFANASVKSIAAIGDLWLGVTHFREMAISTDGGVTWRFGDRKLPTQPSLVMSNGLRFVITCQGSKLYPGGTAFGNGLAVLT